ncbi:MAG TPA: peroxide stress protein YaaA, partial [Porticoccaceae bacterium]|nr:peroxide stress protein YaaA [Porticoccaceae bacterium]
WAQERVRILSGLYGLLRPLDLMQPYRLEMGTKFSNQRGKNLYAFWGDVITEALNKHLSVTQNKTDTPVIVNLASNEYFKSVRTGITNATVITPAFMENKNGIYKIISFYAKRARGLMTSFAIRNRITRVADLKAFNAEDYRYNPELSHANKWVFSRG